MKKIFNNNKGNPLKEKEANNEFENFWLEYIQEIQKDIDKVSKFSKKYIEDNLITESILTNFKTKIIDLIIEKYDCKYKYFSQPVIIKLNKSCYYRLHTDAYAGKVAYTYFLNKKWKVFRLTL